MSNLIPDLSANTLIRNMAYFNNKSKMNLVEKHDKINKKIYNPQIF